MTDTDGPLPAPQTYELPAGRIEVGHAAPGLAVVSLHGEHDLSSEPTLSGALDAAAAHSHLIVDLADCTFIDSTVIAALLRSAHLVAKKGERLVLVIPSQQRQVARIAEMTRLADQIAIHSSRASALSSFDT
jgi:anti-sigma B factor antagonist